MQSAKQKTTLKDRLVRVATATAFLGISSAFVAAAVREDLEYTNNNMYACEHHQELPAAVADINSDGLQDVLVLYDNRHYGCFGTKEGAFETASDVTSRSWSANIEGAYIKTIVFRQKIDEFAELRGNPTAPR